MVNEDAYINEEEATPEYVREYRSRMKDLVAEIRQVRCEGLNIIEARDTVLFRHGVSTVGEFMRKGGFDLTIKKFMSR